MKKTFNKVSVLSIMLLTSMTVSQVNAGFRDYLPVFLGGNTVEAVETSSTTTETSSVRLPSGRDLTSEAYKSKETKRRQSVPTLTEAPVSQDGQSSMMATVGTAALSCGNQILDAGKWLGAKVGSGMSSFVENTKGGMLRAATAKYIPYLNTAEGAMVFGYFANTATVAALLGAGYFAKQWLTPYLAKDKKPVTATVTTTTVTGDDILPQPESHFALMKRKAVEAFNAAKAKAVQAKNAVFGESKPSVDATANPSTTAKKTAVDPKAVQVKNELALELGLTESRMIARMQAGKAAGCSEHAKDNARAADLRKQLGIK